MGAEGEKRERERESEIEWGLKEKRERKIGRER